VTIKKGSPYGEPGGLPPDGVVVDGDGAASELLEACRRDRRPFPVLGLTGGDLCHTLGGQGELAVTFPVDVVEVLVDGRVHLFVAHLIARTRTWSQAFAAMNAQWLGSWNLGPRAHPNDGLVDTYQAGLGVPDRLKVRARLHHGAHLPHPGITERRTSALQVELPRPLPLEADGRPLGRARALSLHVLPDALTVVV
jgi:hypothetical protein